MKLSFLSCSLLAASLWFHAGIASASSPLTIKNRSELPDTNMALFGRGLYPGNDTSYSQIKESGFNTVILSSFYIHSNGDLYSGDDHNPIIHDGKFVGNPDWLKRVASLKQGATSVKRIEILFEGRWFNQTPNTYDFIVDWTTGKEAPGVVTGTSEKSTLYSICKVLKEVVGVDAICIDDESVYNSESVADFGKIIGKLGMHMTLCPFTNIPYWKDVACRSDKGLIDAVYLQCYDGGQRNTPEPWVKGLALDVPLYPIFMCRGAFGTCGNYKKSLTPTEIQTEMVKFKKGYPAMMGGAIWQMADVKNYVRKGCAVQDSTSGTATTVPQYLMQLKNGIQQGL
jgi:hypothetical protein